MPLAVFRSTLSAWFPCFLVPLSRDSLRCSFEPTVTKGVTQVVFDIRDGLSNQGPRHHFTVVGVRVAYTRQTQPQPRAPLSVCIARLKSDRLCLTPSVFFPVVSVPFRFASILSFVLDPTSPKKPLEGSDSFLTILSGSSDLYSFNEQCRRTLEQLHFRVGERGPSWMTCRSHIRLLDCLIPTLNNVTGDLHFTGSPEAA